MASAAIERAIIAAVEGDAIGRGVAAHFGHRRAGRRSPELHVAAPCASADAGAVCLSCNVTLANRGQAEMHCETGVHVLARICPEHGPEAFAWWGEGGAHA